MTDHGTRRATCLWLVPAILAAATAAGAGETRPTRAEFGARLFEQLEARPVDCPKELAESRDDGEIHCGAIDLSARKLKKKYGAFLEDRLGESGPRLAWSHRSGYLMQRFIAEDGPLTLAYDRAERILAWFPGHPCLPSALVEGLDAYGPDGEQVTMPELVHKVRPDYPEEARQRSADGSVVLDVIVLEDGTVRDLCVVQASPVGLGFETAGLAAVSRWRYEPAMREGKPVSALFTVQVGWSIR